MAQLDEVVGAHQPDEAQPREAAAQCPQGVGGVSRSAQPVFQIAYDNAPMPYTLRLTGDGVSIHGSNVRWGFATHGCIGIPKAFAAKLFSVAKVGDEVLIVPGKKAANKAAA